MFISSSVKRGLYVTKHRFWLLGLGAGIVVGIGVYYVSLFGDHVIMRRMTNVYLMFILKTTSNSLKLNVVAKGMITKLKTILFICTYKYTVFRYGRGQIKIKKDCN
jgi:hypothetical protein